MFQFAGELTPHLELKVSEEAVIPAHGESEGISDKVSRAQDLVDLVDALLLVFHDRFIRERVCDELFCHLHAGLIQLPQLYTLLSLPLVEAPYNVRAECLHAEEAFLLAQGPLA